MKQYYKQYIALFLPQGRLLGPAQIIGVTEIKKTIILHIDVTTGFSAKRRIKFTKRTELKTLPIGIQVTTYDLAIKVPDKHTDILIEKILKNTYWSMRPYRTLPKQFLSDSL